MKGLVVLFFLSLTYAQSPLQETLDHPNEILTLMQEAQNTLFVATPIMSPALEQELVNAARRGLRVYLVTLSSNSGIKNLVVSGVNVKTLEHFAEGLLLVDNNKLVIGGFLSSTNAETLKIDVTLYGTIVLEQLKPLWQLAKPPGG